MKTPNKLVIANLRQNKKRTRATLMAIILSCTLLFALGIAFSSYQQYKINRTARETGTYHVMYYDVEYKKSHDYLRNNKNVKDIYIMQQIDTIKLDDKTFYLSYEGKIPILAFSDKLNDEININEGREPENENEIILPRDSLYSLKKKIGDKLGKYTIVGSYKNGIKKYLDHGSLPESIVFAITKKEIDSNNQHSSFFIKYKNIYKSYDYVREDIKHLGITNISSLKVQINKTYLNEYGIGQDNPMYVLLYCVFAFGLFITSTFCMLIIYNAFAISLTERKKQFGILRSIGTSKRKIIGMITKELMILTIISIPVSFCLSSILVVCGLKVVNKLNAVSIPIGFNLTTLLITIFFIIFSMVLAAYTPGRKASKTSPMESIRSTKDYKIKKSRREFKLIKKLFGPEGQLARKNLKRNGRQFSTVVTSLTISLVLFILMSTIVGLFTKYYSFSSLDEKGYDTYISIDSAPNEKSAKFKEDLQKLSTVDNVIQSIQVYAQLDYTSDLTELDGKKEYSHGLWIYIFEQDYYNKLVKDLKLKPDTPILYNVGRYSVKVGDMGSVSDDSMIFSPFKDNPTIRFCEIASGFESSGKCELEFKNLNVITKGLNPDPETEGASLIISESQFDKLYQEYPSYFNTTNAEGEVAPDYSINLLINTNNIREFYKEVKKLLNRYTEDDIYLDSVALDYYNAKMLFITIQLVLYGIIAFIGIISISGMLNSINTNLSLREREFSMLRSIGFSKNSLNKMITLENVFLIFKSVIASMIITLLGYLGLNILMNFDPETGVVVTPIKFRIPYPWVYTIIAIITVILIILFMTSFSIKKIKNQNIIETIRKDSI